MRSDESGNIGSNGGSVVDVGAGSQLDLNSSSWANHRQSLTIQPDEKPEEMNSRLRREEAQSKLDLYMKAALFVFAIVVVGIVFSIAAYKMVTGTADEQKIAIPVVSSIATGLLGFLSGKAIGK